MLCRYEAVVFLFIVHPFDVGDTIVLATGDMVKVRTLKRGGQACRRAGAQLSSAQQLPMWYRCRARRPGVACTTGMRWPLHPLRALAGLRTAAAMQLVQCRAVYAGPRMWMHVDGWMDERMRARVCVLCLMRRAACRLRR